MKSTPLLLCALLVLIIAAECTAPKRPTATRKSYCYRMCPEYNAKRTRMWSKMCLRSKDKRSKWSAVLRF
ncbi:hypothetical protein V5799_010504 [Amblyomma americanum]|uniref:Secreted protein n=1 Tax=Amblyomma americanum TaxID=6943 RepID=A0AAQ4EJN6_AMBAM